QRGRGAGEDDHATAIDVRAEAPQMDPTSRCSHRAHELGHVIGLVPDELRQVSTRAGSLPRRTVKRVYLPICPALKILTSRTAPARSQRSKRPKETSTVPPLALFFAATTRLWVFGGQPWPWQVTLTLAPTGASTVNSAILTPEDLAEPAIRTTGKGCIRVIGCEATVIVSETSLERPLASVTRSRTTCDPAVAKDVLSTCCPATSAPPGRSDQAWVVIGLPASLEVDTSDTASPTCGEAGNHWKEATGGGDGAGGGVEGTATAKVAVPGVALPASSTCSAKTI